MRRIHGTCLISQERIESGLSEAVIKSAVELISQERIESVTFEVKVGDNVDATDLAREN